MNETTRMNIGLFICIIGALMGFLSVMLEWIDISVTFVDGTQSSVSISGWQVLTEDGASEVINGTFIPALVIVLTVASLAVCIATRFTPNVPRPHSIAIMISIVMCAGVIAFMGMNGAIINNTGVVSPSAGMISTTPWIDGMFSEEIYDGRIDSGYGGFIALIGVDIILYWGLIEMMSHSPVYKQLLTSIRFKSEKSEKSLKIEIGRPGDEESENPKRDLFRNHQSYTA